MFKDSSNVTSSVKHPPASPVITYYSFLVANKLLQLQFLHLDNGNDNGTYFIVRIT